MTTTEITDEEREAAIRRWQETNPDDRVTWLLQWLDSERACRTSMDDRPVEMVIGAHDLESHTRDGWVVVERFEEDTLQFGRESVMPETPPQPPGTYYNQPVPISLERTYKLRSSYFRIRFPGPSALANARAKIGQLEASVANFERAGSAATEQRRKLELELTHTKEDAERKLKPLTEAAAATEAARDAAEAERCKLAEDLGKIREAIGTKAYEEILLPTVNGSPTSVHTRALDLDDGLAT